MISFSIYILQKPFLEQLKLVISQNIQPSQAFYSCVCLTLSFKVRPNSRTQRSVFFAALVLKEVRRKLLKKSSFLNRQGKPGDFPGFYETGFG